MELRRELEQTTIAVAEAHGLQGSPGKQMTLATATRLLRNYEIIDAHTSGLLDDLRNIGNAAAHGAENLSKEDAVWFQRLANQALAVLR
jgi:hypothetical protein